LLNDEAAPHGFQGAVKNCNKAVSGRFEQSAVVFCNAGLDEVALDELHARKRALCVEIHEVAEARDVACHNRNKGVRRQRTR
jgi:hypothetical protein